MTKTSLNVKLHVAFGLNIKCLLREKERKKRRTWLLFTNLSLRSPTFLEVCVNCPKEQ